MLWNQKLMSFLLLPGPSHDTDVVGKGLGGVPGVVDHAAHGSETPQRLLRRLRVLVQPVLEQAEVCEWELSSSLLDVAFQLLRELQEPIWFDAIGAFQGKKKKKKKY